MDISKAINGLGAPNPMVEAEGREQAKENAMKQLQARYGEKPKEARPVKKALDKDDFMRIMITEMKHQDPTKPMDAEKMATQMAQITSVEQMKNVGQAVEKLADKNSASDRLAMSAMIGKTVTVDKGRFSHMKGTLSPVSYDLPEAAKKIKLTVLDEHGDEVASRELEPQSAGPNVYNWDGLNVSNVQSPSGNYIVRIDAENAAGKKIKINTVSKETVVGVSFEAGETNFLVGDLKTPQKVNFKNVVRIEGDHNVQSAAAQNIEARAKAAEEAGKNAKNDGMIELPPELKAKFGIGGPAAAGANPRAGVPAGAPAPADVAEAQNKDSSPGFPNGLKD